MSGSGPRARSCDLTGGLLDLIDALLDVAGDHVETVMPGFTHTQRAQPVTLGHHLLAYVSMFERDLERFQQAYARMDRSALGSSAMAGTTYPLDRAVVAPIWASAASRGTAWTRLPTAISSRYPLLLRDGLRCTVSRLCEELVWWSSGEIKYVTFDDAFSTGSSIMPQKKNPDVAELTRGKTGRVFGQSDGHARP